MPATTRSATTAPQCHVLNFIYDDNSGCDLAVLVNGVRFHIMVEESRLRRREETRTSYVEMLAAVRDQEEKELGPELYEERKGEKAFEDHRLGKQPSKNNNSHDSALGSSPPHPEAVDDVNDDVDSAVDVDEDKENFAPDKRCAKMQQEGTEAQEQNPHTRLQKWILRPFGSIFQELAPVSNTPKAKTVHDFYHPTTYFYTLDIEDDEVIAVQLQDEPEYLVRVERLVPRVKIPKYLSEAKIPWFNPQDLMVLSESAEPEPLHPARVQAGDNIYFLKRVDTTEPAPCKREMQILMQLDKLGLRDKINVPKLEGLVSFGNSKTEAMGYLLTDIDQPTPLTLLLDEEVDERKRKRWAKEVDRTVCLLHDHDVVWGDAKADNFLVDRCDKLWIIDFGGSYTDGWVDPELNETEEGDVMGAEKIVKALRHPESQTYVPGDEYAEREGRAEKGGRKRQREDVDEEEEIEDEECQPSKRQKE